MKRAPRSRQRHDLYAKYHDYDSEISDLLGECGMIMRDLFEVSQDAAFSWLNRRGFNDVVIHLYCALEGSEIERGTEKDYVA